MNGFNKKGTAAEELIADLCKEAFFQDFCFINPYYEKGKELCDVLIVLNDVAIIWQIKNLKLGEDGRFSESEIAKAIKQCRGAKRTLSALSSLAITNVAGVTKTVNVKQITKVYMIAAIEGGTEEFSSYFDQDDNRGDVHIFYEAFTRYATKHLNTVSDFVKYLADAEAFLHDRSVLIGGGEEDLLATYLRNARSFGGEEVEKSDHVFFDIEGAAKQLESDPDYQEKLTADKWSEGWDELIKKKREGIAQNGSRDDQETRGIFLAKMMSHNRFERRNLSKAFFDAASGAAKTPYQRTYMYRRYVPISEAGVTYVFCFMGSTTEPREPRQAILSYVALAARARFPKNQMVIAVVTELHMVKTRESGFDWVMMDLTDEQLTAELTPERVEMFKQLKILTKPEMQFYSTYEYPSDMRKLGITDD